MIRRATQIGALLALSAIAPARAETVGKVGVDWVGNDIMIEAVADPGLPAVTCYVTYFDRSVFDRLQNGNWFENPSNSALSCVATAPVSAQDVAALPDEDTIFSERQSLVFKSLTVSRVIDRTRNVLVYLAHASELTEGSAKMSVSVVPISGAVPPPTE